MAANIIFSTIKYGLNFDNLRIEINLNCITETIMRGSKNINPKTTTALNTYEIYFSKEIIGSTISDDMKLKKKAKENGITSLNENTTPVKNKIGNINDITTTYLL